MAFHPLHGNTDAIMAETLTATSEDREILGRAPVRALLDRIRDAVRVTDAGAVELVDESALRERIITILAHASATDSDPDVRDTMAIAARRRAREVYEPDTLARTCVESYRAAQRSRIPGARSAPPGLDRGLEVSV